MAQRNQPCEQSISPEQIFSLFEGFKKIFGGKAKLDNYDADMVQIWHIALSDLGMTQQEFNLAKRKTLSLTWQPTTPADFVALARVSEEYKNSETAFKIACTECGKMPEHRNWTDSVIYETSRRCGTNTLASCSNGYIKQFRAVYQQVITEHQAGKEFTIPKPAREIEVKPASQDFVDELLKKHGWHKEKTA